MVNQFMTMQTLVTSCEPDFQTPFQAQKGVITERAQSFRLPGAMMDVEVGKQREVQPIRSNAIFGEDRKLLVG